ncbi:peptide ABC transporter substrate-binding protein [Lactobacillus sp. LC28-10]|uniref:Peptide ABC transporter substrate-binding protein n=1 Tax=Secundilactobacillus angelensis TaxID=2722706 RepID=A0ABX1KVX9_9LACO|nr:peptide ABC transporter substrate-binding protein [Secundilactobacillus angelensis]MCH5462430.1 peptide ABC transporter substrate-binding protein [Secundilactobacillus angelensis]NLR18088.1 peptide ABC transporter substrate-binding protein [Secundilactobacillus angelensis]
MTSKLKLIGIIVAALLLGGCQQKLSNSKQASDSKGVMSQNQNVTVVEQTRLNTVDISKVSSFNKLRSSTEGLFRLGNNGRVNNGLAQSYRISKNAKTYTFKLRNNARWSNGQPITASDFVYSWQRSVNPQTRSVNSNLFDGIKNADKIRKGELKASRLGVKALSNHELQVTLEHPMVYFETMLAYPLFAPQHRATVQRYGSAYGASANKQIYSGPFKLVKWHANSASRTLVPNPYYWDKSHVYLKRLTIVTSKSPSQDLKAYQKNKVAEIQLIGKQIPENKNNPDYVVRPFSLMRIIAYNFNTSETTNKKLINNRNARLAISHAISRRQLINNALQNASLPPKGFVTAGLSKNNLNHSDFANQQEASSYVKGNVKSAATEWATAKRQLNGRNFKLTLVTPNDVNSVRVAKNIKTQLESKLTGLTVKVVSLDSTHLTTRISHGQFDLLLTGWGADYPDPLSFLQAMTSNSRHNYGRWHDATYDHLVDIISNNQSTNNQLRWGQMLTAEKRLTQQQGVTPLYQQADSFLTNPKLNGVVHNISGVVEDYKSAYWVK